MHEIWNADTAFLLGGAELVTHSPAINHKLKENRPSWLGNVMKDKSQHQSLFDTKCDNCWAKVPSKGTYRILLVYFNDRFVRSSMKFNGLDMSREFWLQTKLQFNGSIKGHEIYHQPHHAIHLLCLLRQDHKILHEYH